MSQPTKWREVIIGDVGRVLTGRTPSTKCPEYFGDEFLFITPGDMHQGKHVRLTARSLSSEGASLLRRIELPPRSVCVSCIGWQMGEVVMTSAASFTNQQINSIVPRDGVDADFLYYSLVPRKQELLSLASAIGVRTPILNKSAFEDISIVLPPLPTQRKIAAILSAYDDLIENNNRRIAILEEMAQSIYREWFVHYRFPGHESVPQVDSELGPIPEGWTISSLGNACVIIMGQSPKSEFYNENGDGLPFHQGVKDFGHRFPTTRVYCTVESRIADPGDILLSVRAPVGRINVADKRIVIGRGLCAVRAKNGNQVFVFHQLKEQFFEEDMIGSGAIFQAVTKNDLLSLPFLCPPPEITGSFEAIAVPFFLQIEVLTRQTSNLRQTRDLLLPRLVSGELDVSELEIDTGNLD